MQDKEDLMVSGNPPRHSKSADEPVTIDLDAREFATAADTEKPVENPAGDADGTAAADDGLPPETEAASHAEREDELGTDVPEEEPVAPQPSFTPPEQSAPKSAGTSGLIAAGIFGGLVALLGAGAIQYAGYLPGSSAPQTTSPETANLAGEIDGLKQAVANLAANPASTDDGELAKRVAALETAAKAPAVAAPADSANVEALNQKIAELTGQLDQLRATLAQSSEQQTTNGADIAKRLEEAEKKLNEPREDVAVARAIAAAALKAAIDRGGPFLAELDTFAGVAPDDPAVADLKAFAETGIPSRTELVGEVPDVATAIVEAVNQPDPNQSWSDRLMSSAKSLVSVRPVGNIEGESVEAIAARMEEKVKSGDLPGASAEWNSLPALGKQASAAFKQSLEARIRVEELVGGALSKAVSGTGKEG
ncbi:COG4223 family protein [Rhizobium sp. WYCCWR 11146]|uniref:COG4223 family protein n=1 Tax=Rhizobium sp. WYCCWR 11146 TaxID=2749833 RepID=UPI0015E6D4C6|nr:COG4223 family protein [Rhizobium sp. WYCCWR 11146]MBA1346579.1 COG4223 family protein [Rhizobium sp. WYCCWR 11146]